MYAYTHAEIMTISSEILAKMNVSKTMDGST